MKAPNENVRKYDIQEQSRVLQRSGKYKSRSPCSSFPILASELSGQVRRPPSSPINSSKALRTRLCAWQPVSISNRSPKIVTVISGRRSCSAPPSIVNQDSTSETPAPMRIRSLHPSPHSSPPSPEASNCRDAPAIAPPSSSFRSALRVEPGAGPAPDPCVPLLLVRRLGAGGRTTPPQHSPTPLRSHILVPSGSLAAAFAAFAAAEAARRDLRGACSPCHSPPPITNSAVGKRHSQSSSRRLPQPAPPSREEAPPAPAEGPSGLAPTTAGWCEESWRPFFTPW